MKPWRALAARLWAGGPVLLAARILLLAWALGLLVTAYELGRWRQELSSTLLQLNADAQFRARVASREAVDPAWYRRKALALLAAADRLQRDASWSTFIPGSWRVFDDLEERVQARIESEFGEIVVETIRRELDARASRLTGVPLAGQAGQLQQSAGADCQAPQPLAVQRRSGAIAELPEFITASEYISSIEQLNAAMTAFLALQQSSGQPAQLRQLVAYALGAELPGTLAASARLFHRPGEVNLQPALQLTRMQWASRCALARTMAALHARLLDGNELITLEQALAQRSAGLFEIPARSQRMDQLLEQYRSLLQIMERQRELLAEGHNAWMRQDSLQLGDEYEGLLRRIGAPQLLGPEAAQQVRAQAAAAFAGFRRQFEAAFGSAEPGIVWSERDGRFVPGPQREGLRQGLAALLRLPFLAEPGQPSAAPVRTASSLAEVLDQAVELVAAREEFVSGDLPRLPPRARPAVLRLVDHRLVEQVYEQAFRALKASLPADPAQPLDPVLLRQQREQLTRLQALLRRSGGSWLAQRLQATLDGELQRRLAALHESWRQQALFGADFSQWQGEPLAPGERLGASASAGGGGGALAPLAWRLEALDQQARDLIELAGPGLADDPLLRRWEGLRGELARYRGGREDSSLRRLERWLQVLGSDLRPDNCAARLAAAPAPAAAGDEIAQRHGQLRQVLATRCAELQARAAAEQALRDEPAATPPLPAASLPPSAPAQAPLPAVLPPPLLRP